MKLRKNLLILVFLTASESIFIGCTDQTKNELDPIFKAGILTRGHKTLISQYDPIIREHAASGGYDWRFIAAIGYHESRFCNDVVSPVGAVGIMQVMPSVARAFGVSAIEIKDPQTNVATAIRVLKAIEKSMQFPASVSPENRMKIVLACYNGGIGHIMDARRLAAKHGANHTQWSEVERYLQIKGLPEYADPEVVKCGRFSSNETSYFVKVVMQQYHNYCNKYPA